jgi:hypothetical protein
MDISARRPTSQRRPVVDIPWLPMFPKPRPPASPTSCAETTCSSAVAIYRNRSYAVAPDLVGPT